MIFLKVIFVYIDLLNIILECHVNDINTTYGYECDK